MSEAIERLAAHRAAGELAPSLPYVVLDVFTELPLSGNPLAVFTDARGLSAETMQRIARELNLSETAFVLPADREADLRVRIFTPSSELPFAGHPVLGTAILAGRALARRSLTLQTGQGPIAVELSSEGGRADFGRMSQPPPVWEPFEPTDELLRALGLAASRLPIELYLNGPRHVLVCAADARQVSTLRPDVRLLTSLGALGVSCFAGDGRRWRTRMFAPALGVPEDPATGSAAGPLALHLARHGEIGFGEEIEIAQGAELGRPSLLYARASGSADRIERVEVAGHGVVVAEGRFSV